MPIWAGHACKKEGFVFHMNSPDCCWQSFHGSRVPQFDAISTSGAELAKPQLVHASRAVLSMQRAGLCRKRSNCDECVQAALLNE